MTTGQEQTPVKSDHGREDAHWRNTLPHLSACLAVGALVILVLFAIHAIHWVT
jgi:uncharacterized membrane protein